MTLRNWAATWKRCDLSSRLQDQLYRPCPATSTWRLKIAEDTLTQTVPRDVDNKKNPIDGPRCDLITSQTYPASLLAETKMKKDRSKAKAPAVLNNDYCSSGIQGLDHILNGGLPRDC